VCPPDSSRPSQQRQQSEHEIIQSVEDRNVYELAKELNAISDRVSDRLGEQFRQFDESIEGIISEKFARISAAVFDEDLDGISVPFFEAMESIVKLEINVDTFINTMVFCIKLVRRYRKTSPTTFQDKAMWMTEQICELMESAYQRYRIGDWIEEQGGWPGVLRLVRKKYQTITDYGERWGVNRVTVGVAGAIVGVVAIAIWYNW